MLTRRTFAATSVAVGLRTAATYRVGFSGPAPIAEAARPGLTVAGLADLTGDEFLDAYSKHRGALYGPVAAVGSYFSAVYLREYAVAHAVTLSADSRAAFEKVGGFQVYSALTQESWPHLDLGTMVADIYENQAMVVVRISQDAAAMLLNPRRTKGGGRFRHAPTGRGYPSTIRPAAA